VADDLGVGNLETDLFDFSYQAAHGSVMTVRFDQLALGPVQEVISVTGQIDGE
jgi:hypothetical protein